MPLYVFAFFLGISALQLSRSLPHGYIVAVISVFNIAICFALYYFCKTRATATVFSKILTCVVMGFIWSWFCTTQVLAWSLPHDLENKNLIVTGYIDSLPQIDNRRASFIFATKTIEHKTQHTKLKLNWYYTYPNLMVGDKWQLEVRLKPPIANLNPGGFDFAKYLFQHKIRAIGYVISSIDNNNNKILSENKYQHTIDKIRQYLKQIIQQALFNQQLEALITTLIIGDQSDISKTQWEIFRDTGTSYLMAISGLHIGLFAGFVMVFVRSIWRLFPRMVLLIPATQAGAIAGLISGIFYSIISGFSVPTQRALVMLTAFLLTLLLRISHQSWYAFFLSMFVVLAIDPVAVLEIGFWLSFAAVAIILYFSNNRLRFIQKWWQRTLRMQWAITLGLMPLTLLLFQQFSWLSIIANLFALPLVCFIVVPICLSGCLLLLINFYCGRLVLLLAEKILELTWIWLKHIAALAYINWHHPIFNFWIFAAATIGSIVLLSPRGMPGKIAGAFLLLPLGFYQPKAPGFATFSATMLDVNQGEVIVIKTKTHALLYYLNPAARKINQSNSIVIPFLHFQNIRAIDALMVGKIDAEANAILAQFSAKNIYAAENVDNNDNHVNGKINYCQAGESWNWDGIDFRILYPFLRDESNYLHPSCVLKISAGSSSILLAGNINAAEEKILANIAAKALAAPVLVTPYRSSNFAIAPEFIAAISPKYALISANHDTSKRLMAQNINANYLFSKTKLLTTAKSGAITVIFRDKRLQLTEYRKDAERYWDK